MLIMDYNKPPTEEFARLTDNTRYPNQWLTMLKCVLNDYYFDVPPTFDLEIDDLDHMFHKIYYCWLQAMKELHPEELE